jgi:hypothetical protein
MRLMPAVRSAAVPLALVLATGSATAQGREEIVSVGSESALKVGDAVIARPFGAMLVDRLAVAGSARAGGNRYLLVRGDAGGACPTRYLIVQRDGRGEPVLSEPFGTCAGGARLRPSGGTIEVSMPATAAGGPTVRYRYTDGRMALVGAAPAASVAAAGYGARAPSSCRSQAATDPAQQQVVIDDFTRSYPAEYRSYGALRRTAITPDELRATVTGLACLATWPGAEKVVPRTATPLFASKRYGRAAFSTLAAVAQDPLSDANLRASVRAFSAEMVYRVGKREPL